MKMIKSSISLKETQRLELGILDYLDKACSKYNIEYFLAYGSLIGAIRHKGFIPWDDDIDIMMFRSEFYKLVDALKKEKHPYYKLISYETNSKFTAPLPKIIDARTELVQNYDYREKVSLGVYIDIFILDGAGNSWDEVKKNYERGVKLYRKWRIADFRIFPPNRNKLYGILRWIKHMPNNIFGISYHLKKIKKFGEERPVATSSYVATFSSGSEDIKRNVWRKDDFLPSVKVDFEDLHLNAPQNFNSLLTCEYGDYMKLPPRDNRMPHHDYTLKWRNDKS